MSAELLGWVENSKCDAWFLHYHSQDGLTYASQWHADQQVSEPVAYTATLDRWTDYYRRSGIEQIASGAVILRRRSSGAPNWTHWDEMPRAPVGDPSDHLDRVFAAYDFLAERPDDADLLGSTFQLVDGHQLTQRLAYRDSRYAVAETSIVLDQGVGLTASVPTEALQVVLRFDGQRSLGTLIDEVAAESGMPIDDLRCTTVRAARELYTRGLIVRYLW